MPTFTRVTAAGRDRIAFEPEVMIIGILDDQLIADAFLDRGDATVVRARRRPLWCAIGWAGSPARPRLLCDYGPQHGVVKIPARGRHLGPIHDLAENS